MADSTNLGSLFYTLDLDDKEFERKMKEKADKYGVNLTIKTKIEGADTQKYFEVIEKSSASTSKRIKDDMERNIPAMMKIDDRLKQLNKWYTELEKSSEAAGRAQETANERALRAADKLAASQRKQQGKQSQGEFKEYISSMTGTSDISKQMSAYYREMEKAKNSQDKYNRAIQIGSSNQRQFANSAGLTNKTLFSQRTLAIQLSNQIGTMFSIYAAERFITKLADVRGEFEMQQISLRAILQDADAANTIFNQIKQLAVVSPFEFKDLVGYTKQLSAFSVPVDELYDTMKSLADVSSGLGVDMGRIILAYGQVRSASVLRGQELRQFTEAGIPLVDELAKKFAELKGGIDASGKAIKAIPAGEVFDLISQRAVPFKMVQEVFESLTSEGGKFYMMQEKQSESLKGKIANLADSYAIMLNEIGEANDGILKGGVEAISGLMDNWKELSKVLLAVIAAYGTYKAVVIMVTMAEKTLLAIQTAQHFINLTRALSGASSGMIALGKASKIFMSSPIGMIAGILAAATAAMILFRKETLTTTEVISKMDTSVTQFTEATKDIDKLVIKYDELADKTDKSEEEQRKLKDVISQIATVVPGAVTSLNQYTNAIELNMDKVREYSEVQKENFAKELRASIDSGKERIRILQQQQAEYDKMIKTGRKTQLNVLGGGMIKLSEEETADVVHKFNKITLEINSLIKSSSNAEKALSGIFVTDKPAEYAKWATTINEQINGLNFSHALKESVKIKDATTSFDDYKKTIVSTFDEIKAQLLRRQQTKGIFNEEDTKNLKDQYDLYSALLALLGGKDAKKNDKSDPVADKLSEQIKLTKEAYTEYERLSKLYAKPVAEKMVKESPGFKNVAVSTTKDELSQNLQSFYNQAVSLTSDKGKKVLQQLMKDIRQATVGGLTDAVNAAFEVVNKKISQYKGRYNFYEDVLGITGDEQLSLEVAFGDVDYSMQSYIDYAKSQLQEAAKTSGLTTTTFDELMGLSDIEKTKLPDQIKTMMDDIQKEIQDNKISVTIDAQNLIQQYASIEDKITTIQNKGEVERKKARQTLTDAEYGKYEEASLTRQNEEITKLREEMLQLLPVWDDIFGESRYKSYAEIEKASKTAQQILDNATVNYDKKTNKPLSFSSAYTTDTGDEQKVVGTIALLEKLRKAIDSLGEDAQSKNPFAELAKNIKAMFAETKEGDKESESFNKKLSKLGSSAASAANMIGSAAGSLGEMFDAMGNEGMANAMTNAEAAMESVANIGEGFAKGGIIGGIAAAVGEAAKWIGKIFAANDARLEKSIKESEKRVKVLKGVYEDLERTVDKALGEERYSHTDEQLKNLAQQQKELYKQANLESQKKKADDDKVSDLRDEAADITNQMEDLITNILEDITGGARSIAETLGNAFFDAFAAGEDSAKAWASTVKSLVGDIARNMLIQKYLEPQIGAILDKHTAGWFDGNNLNIDKVLSSMGGLSSDLNGLLGSWSTVFENLSPELKELLKGTGETADTLSKSIQGVTEETANLLASLINAMRMDVSFTRETLVAMQEVIGRIELSNLSVVAQLSEMNGVIKGFAAAFESVLADGHRLGGTGIKVFVQ